MKHPAYDKSYRNFILKFKSYSISFIYIILTSTHIIALVATMGIKDMNRKGILINVAVFVGFLILCMGGGGLMGAITRNDFGDSSEW